MEPLQALEILDNIGANVALNRADRQQVDGAIATLHRVVVEHKRFTEDKEAEAKDKVPENPAE